VMSRAALPVLGAPVDAPDVVPDAAIDVAAAPGAPVDAVLPQQLGRLLRTRTDRLSLRSWR